MKYIWRTCEEDSNYEELLRPDGTVVATITEPEDRIGCRDLDDVVKEMNKLYAELKEIQGKIVMNHETYENLFRVANKRKRLAMMRGDWVDVSEISMEIILLEKTFKKAQNMNEITGKEGE